MQNAIHVIAYVYLMCWSLIVLYENIRQCAERLKALLNKRTDKACDCYNCTHYCDDYRHTKFYMGSFSVYGNPFFSLCFFLFYAYKFVQLLTA